jgi:hypothetical protein
LTPALPQGPQSLDAVYAHPGPSLSNSAGHDPSGALVAFNASRAQFDIYNQTTSTKSGSISPAWFGGNFTGVSQNTGFNVTIPTGTVQDGNVTWARVNIPHGNFSSTTILRFDWRGNLGNGTRASYFVYNGTSFIPGLSVTKINQTTINGGPPGLTGSIPPLGCASGDECLDVSKFIGFNLTLTFHFNSTSTGKRLSVRVSDIEVVSADLSPTSSSFHAMKINPADSTRILHNANITLGAFYANVTYRKPNTSSVNLNHNWTQMAIIYNYPNSYQQININQTGAPVVQNGTATTSFARGKCSDNTCTNSQFIALNMTSASHVVLKMTVTITARSLNLEAGVQTTLGGVPTSYWGPGDLLQVKVNLRQGVNVTGSSIVSGNTSGIVRITQTFTNIREGVSLQNFTTPIPQDASLLGVWSVNSTFINGYDYGYNFTTFTLEQLGVHGFSYSGSNQRLSAGGTLTYGSNNASAASVNGYVFAIDSGSGAAPLSTSTTTSGTGMYVANITLANGVFTSGQHLIMMFTLINPTGIGLNANVTINHEWVSNTSHNSSATIPIPWDAPFLFASRPDYVYRLDFTLTPAGITGVLTSLSTSNSASFTLPPGNPPVTSLRQQAGLFKLTVKSTPASPTVTSPCVPPCVNSKESPAYAYVLVSPPLPGRLLASGNFTSNSSGAIGKFSALITSGSILGASKLVFLSLGRDPNGLAITVQGQSTAESTILQASIGNIPTATENQATTVTLHLASTSTIVDMNITISLSIPGSGTGTLKTLYGNYIMHGTSKDVPFSFNAPSTVGVYTLVFFSPEYGGPLITETLQVSLLQSNLQIIIPAIIGLVAAILILLFFVFRKKPVDVTSPSAKEKPAGGKPKPNPGSSPRNP